MATFGRVGAARGALVLAALSAAGLAGCSSDAPKTKTAATGTAPAAPTDTAPTTQTSAPPPCTFAGSTERAQGPGDAPTRLLTDVRVGAHGCYDRVTFELKPKQGDTDGPVSWKARYEEPPITEDASGRTVAVKGNAFLVVTMSATGVDLTREAAPATYTGPASIEAADTTRIRQVRRIGDFEGVLTWVIGVDTKRPFHVTTDTAPARVVVDVGG